MRSAQVVKVDYWASPWNRSWFKVDPLDQAKGEKQVHLSSDAFDHFVYARLARDRERQKQTKAAIGTTRYYASVLW